MPWDALGRWEGWDSWSHAPLGASWPCHYLLALQVGEDVLRPDCGWSDTSSASLRAMHSRGAEATPSLIRVLADSLLRL